MKMHLKRSVVYLISVLLASTAFASNDGHSTSKKQAKSHGGHSSAHWSYEGAEGPGRWGDLAEAYELCKEGYNQSPIDISESAPQELDKLEFHYSPTSMNVINNGHTIQANYNGNSVMKIAGETYRLLQFHFHAPSEHMIDGRHADMEVHLVHKSDDGRLAVVGIMMQKGGNNNVIAPIWTHMPTAANKNYTSSASINADDLLPGNHEYFHYNGSLTTPPCSEGVRWFVMRKPISVSSAQINKFIQVIDQNSRPVQSLNARTVRVSE